MRTSRAASAFGAVLLTLLALIAATGTAEGRQQPAPPTGPAGTSPQGDPAPAVSSKPPLPESLDRIVCEIDPTQTYAADLPPGYDPARAWPVVMLMDPRGRAAVPLELFRPAARRLGYILISSYNTMSDGPWEPNEKAVRAMIPDATRRFSIDRRRLYLAGFSGTARVAWDFSRRLRDGVAGVIGFGAGLPSEEVPSPAPAFFGGVGDQDFNYQELRALDKRLDELGLPHHIVFFEGEHAWPSEGVVTASLDWMELQAMRARLRPRDDALVTTMLESRMARARGLEASDPYEALREHRSIALDFDGLAPVEETRARIAALEKDKRVKQVEDRMKRVADRERAYQTQLGTFLGQFHVTNPPPSVAESLRTLKIAALQTDVKGDEPLQALSARRLLNTVKAHTAFYEPVTCLEKGDAARAAAFLGIAEALEPEDAGVQVMVARARAQMGQKKEALDALARAASYWPGLNPGTLRADKYLAPLKEDPRFEEILASLKG